MSRQFPAVRAAAGQAGHRSLAGAENLHSQLADLIAAIAPISGLGAVDIRHPEANWLILRHFWIGSENLGFLSANIEGGDVEMNPLRPVDLPDLVDDLFIKHDLNLFNFVTRLNLKLRGRGG